ncbi:lipase family protein [Saccharopolyspora pogona]|uniref:lipase family protein n=1 Tax=Saccharopolyspora pogona TaxID=333966 RepID=UPI001685B69E|nr:lipase family protein [Saccharopolyspora pogona]
MASEHASLVGDDLRAPADDPFYRPPTPLPPGAPGTLIRARPVTALRSTGEPVAAKVWQILYRSNSAIGRPNAVSGTVLVPNIPWPGEDRPIITFAVGTHGLGSQVAPSYLLRTGTEPETELIAVALDRGWAVVITDYEGLGTPGTHTYTVGRPQGHAMLDAARAAQRLPGSGLGTDCPVGIWGYAQGGQASAFAGELHPTYAPELPIRAAAAGAVPIDLLDILHRNDGVFTGPVLAGLVGHAAAYPDLPFDELLTDAGRIAVDQVRELGAPELVTRFLGRELSDFLDTSGLFEHPRWRARLVESVAGRNGGPVVPTLVYHSTDDEIVPFAFGERLRDSYRAAGTPVRWHPLSGLAHFPAALASSRVVVSWFDEHFSGPSAISGPRDDG